MKLADILKKRITIKSDNGYVLFPMLNNFHFLNTETMYNRGILCVQTCTHIKRYNAFLSKPALFDIPNI